MKYVAAITFLSVLLINKTFSQPSESIRGKVVDQESKIPLRSANVMILEAGPITGVITDERGSFTIEEVPVGRYNLMISHVGYKSFIIRDVLVGTAKEVFLEVGMREKVFEMEEVTIAAYESKDLTINPMAGISARSFTVEETERFPGSWGDPARMASNYAGVFSNGDIFNYMVIRGNSPYGLIWRMEGIPIPNPNHFDFPGAKGGPISIVNNRLLTRSDFLSSAFPAEYSNGVSGVFDLNLRNGNNRKREYVAEVGLMGLGFGAEGPFSKNSEASYLVDYRHSTLGLVDELLWVGALPRYQDLNYKLNFPTNKGNISLFGFVGNSRIFGKEDDPNNSVPSFKRQITSKSGARTFVSGLKHVHFFGSQTRIINDFAVSTNRSHQYNDSLVNGDVTKTLIHNNYREDRLLLSSKILSKLNSKNSISGGITLEDHFFNYYLQNELDLFRLPDKDSLVTYPPNILEDDHLIIFKGFVEWKHRFSNNLTLYTGLNYLHFFMNNSKALEPRVNIRWRLSEKHRLSMGYGLHSQIHPFYHYYIRKYTTDDKYDRENYIETNLNLDFTRSHHFALGYDFLLSRNLRFKAEVYQQMIYDVPVEIDSSYFSLINLGAGSNNVTADNMVNEGTAYNRGMEFTLEKFLSKQYYFLITWSLLDSKYKGSDGIERNTAFNNNYNLNALVGYEFPFRENGAINLDLRFVTAGGRRIIPHDVEKTLEEGDDVYLFDQAYEHRLNDYYRLDVRFGYKYNRIRVRHEVGLDITNLTNRLNEWEWSYVMTTESLEMQYQQGIFLFLYYRINF